ncbi:hypothetical protein ACIGXM_11005 [Kitasatospora sp. NPDC052896]|uniref:IS1096 element passenger TnpR family protein n=1 Tax=Kitasatospora sp. NPDC052896 TaxID=3364061 RepID=UPI0037C8F1FB
MHVHSHTTSLSGLHAVIQVTMGWNGAHRHQFGARRYGHDGHPASAYGARSHRPTGPRRNLNGHSALSRQVT